MAEIRRFASATSVTDRHPCSGWRRSGRFASRAKKPNVLYIFSDQHRALSLPGEPFNQAIAPAIDRFRHDNLSMDCCVSNYPLCTPYRAILMSGRWPTQTGVIQNGVHLKPDGMMLGDTFQKNGYHTGYIGKWHLAGEDNGFIPKGPGRLGFEDWHVWDKTNDHYHSWTYNQETGEKITPEGWQPTRMTDQAIDFLKAQPKDKPWMLVVSWNPPHPPYNPPQEDASQYPVANLKFRPNVRVKPAGRPLAGPAHVLNTEDTLRQAMQGYYGAITGIDKEFARILSALEANGQADDTIVIYTSDHGDMMGSQGRIAKQVPFEESCRVPFIVRYPGVTPQNRKSDALFAAIDIYPTVCGLAGIPAPKQCAGTDLSAGMRGGKMAAPEAVFLMNHFPVDGSDSDEESEGEAPRAARRAAAGNATERTKYVNQPSYRAIRTATHTYAVAYNGRWLLYDNVADPYQLKNLIHDPTQLPLMEKLDGLIRTWMKSTGDKFAYDDALKTVSDFPD